MLDLTRVKVMGRCPEDGGCLWLTFPLSEVSFQVSGASFLRLRLRGDHTERKENCGSADGNPADERFGI